MAGPIQTAPPISASGPSAGRLAMNKASADAPIATTTESSTRERPYRIGIGRWKASMPMKCMLQMPTPMATEPPASHAKRSAPRAAVILAASSSAV